MHQSPAPQHQQSMGLNGDTQLEETLCSSKYMTFHHQQPHRQPQAIAMESGTCSAFRSNKVALTLRRKRSKHLF